jgi:hypothetical protein
VRQHKLQFIRFKLGRIKGVLFIDAFQATLEIPHYKSESTDSASNFSHIVNGKCYYRNTKNPSFAKYKIGKH